MHHGHSEATPVPEDVTGSTASLRTRKWLYLWSIAFVSFYLVGVAVRLHGVLTRGYDSDALSTLYYFVGLPPSSIMTSWSLPNNHALSTLLIKFSIAVFGETPLGIRLPSFLFGLLIPVSVAVTTFVAFRSRLAALVALALAVGDGALIYYASVGRGYSIQSALIMGLVLAVIAYERGLRDSPNGARCCRIFILTLPFAAILTIPSSLIFVGALITLHVGYLAFSCRRKMTSDGASFKAWARGCLRQNRPVIMCYGVVVIMMGVWFATIWRMISEGQAHGVAIEGIKHFFRFSYGTLNGLKAWLAILLGIPLLMHRKYRYLGAFSLTFVGLSLASSLITKGGPPRVYVPILPVLFVSAGGGVMVAIEYIAGMGIFGRRALAPVGVACVLFLCLWGMESRADYFTMTLDFHKSWFELKEAIPQDACILYPAERGLYLHYYDPGFAAENAGRAPRRECTIALLEAREDAATVPNVQTLSGIALANMGDVLQLTIEDATPIRTLRFPNCVASIYPLRSVRDVESLDRAVILAAIHSAPPPLIKEIVSRLTDDGSKAASWCLMNPFHRPLSQSGTSIVLATKGLPIPLASLVRLEELTGHAVRFFAIGSNGSGGTSSGTP